MWINGNLPFTHGPHPQNIGESILKINKKRKEQLFVYICEDFHWAKAFVSINYILLFIKESRVILPTWHDHCVKVHPTCLITLTFIMALASVFRDRSLLCLISLFPRCLFPFLENPTVVAIQGYVYMGVKWDGSYVGLPHLENRRTKQQQHHPWQRRATTLPELS